MADENKNAKAPSSTGNAQKVSPDELRDLDVLDSKVEKVKGGAGRKRPRT